MLNILSNSVKSCEEFLFLLLTFVFYLLYSLLHSDFLSTQLNLPQIVACIDLPEIPQILYQSLFSDLLLHSQIFCPFNSLILLLNYLPPQLRIPAFFLHALRIESLHLINLIVTFDSHQRVINLVLLPVSFIVDLFVLRFVESSEVLTVRGPDGSADGAGSLGQFGY